MKDYLFAVAYRTDDSFGITSFVVKNSKSLKDAVQGAKEHVRKDVHYIKPTIIAISEVTGINLAVNEDDPDIDDGKPQLYLVKGGKDD